jgi:hypothetical protein
MLDVATRGSAVCGLSVRTIYDLGPAEVERLKLEVLASRKFPPKPTINNTYDIKECGGCGAVHVAVLLENVADESFVVRCDCGAETEYRAARSNEYEPLRSRLVGHRSIRSDGKRGD